MKSLFLNPPSFLGFDGGAGSRYQARREVRSFWYPTWLAQAAAMVDDSRVVDAPADGLDISAVLNIARDFDLVIVYTSTPSFASDSRTAVRIKHQRPGALIGFVGPHVTVLPEQSLREASAVDFVIRGEFEVPVREIARGRPLSQVGGASWRDVDTIRHNPDSELLQDLDSLPFVVDVYKRDLTVENYYIGYLMHPYLSLYTGRGCPARCTFCLWPQTISGHKYRVRSPHLVYDELARARDLFPQVKEFFIDDDTFTANPSRAADIAGMLSRLGVTWSTSSRANVPYETLKALKASGLRLLMVGYESGSDKILANIRKGVTTAQARRFTADCKSLDIAIHGTFCLGLPGETRETIEQTMRYAQDLDPNTMQVSVAAPYPGTEFHRQAVENGWLAPSEMVAPDGRQVWPLRYDTITGDQVLSAVDRFYKRFYFRPRVVARIGGQMARDPEVRKRRLREGREFLSFLHRDGRARGRSENVLKRVLRDGGPGFCQFAITDACNAHCGFCEFRAESSPDEKRIRVPLDQACAALDVLGANGVDYLAFVGGEPTLHPELPQMLAHAKNLGMTNIICTNGSLLTPENVERYAMAGLDNCIISMDATDAQTHEANRGLPGVCDRVARANALLHEARISTTASVTISRLIDDFDLLPDFLESLGFRQVTFSYPLRSLASGFRGYSQSELINYTDDELVASFDQIKKLKKLRRRLQVVNPTASLTEMQRFVRGEKQRFPCLAGLKYFYLDWKFDLYRCHAWHEPMCRVFDLDSSRLIRDGCTCCMIDCYRDASVLHSVGMALYDARSELAAGRPVQAARRVLNQDVLQAARSLLEDIRWIRGL